ncbi:MAG: hypothetical protein J5I92_16720 [Thiogranum sp.]|nr:hypothetical protein [Thiogranum sp.]
MQSGARIWLGDDGVVRIVYPQDFELTLEVMQTVYQQHIAITTDKRPLLVYAESIASAEYEAQQFASRGEVVELVSGMAIIVKSVFTRAMADLFMKFHRPPYPTRVFTDENAALRWLGEVCPDLRPDPQGGLPG